MLIIPFISDSVRSCGDNGKQVTISLAHTHAQTHARTHAHTHTHIFCYVLVVLVAQTHFSDIQSQISCWGIPNRGNLP